MKISLSKTKVILTLILRMLTRRKYNFCCPRSSIPTFLLCLTLLILEPFRPKIIYLPDLCLLEILKAFCIGTGSMILFYDFYISIIIVLQKEFRDARIPANTRSKRFSKIVRGDLTHRFLQNFGNLPNRVDPPRKSVCQVQEF